MDGNSVGHECSVELHALDDSQDVDLDVVHTDQDDCFHGHRNVDPADDDQMDDLHLDLVCHHHDLDGPEHDHLREMGHHGEELSEQRLQKRVLLKQED